jgi:hypothetical protein
MISAVDGFIPSVSSASRPAAGHGYVTMPPPAAGGMAVNSFEIEVSCVNHEDAALERAPIRFTRELLLP